METQKSKTQLTLESIFFSSKIRELFHWDVDIKRDICARCRLLLRARAYLKQCGFRTTSSKTPRKNGTNSLSTLTLLYLSFGMCRMFELVLPLERGIFI